MLGRAGDDRDDARDREGGEQGPVTFDASRPCTTGPRQPLVAHRRRREPRGQGPSAIDISDADGGLWVGMRHFAEKWRC